MNKEIVRHMPTLRVLLKAGLINFCNQTGTKIHGLYDRKLFTCCYIDGATGSSLFEYKGVKYAVEYTSGCFYPYVFKITDNK